MSDPKDLTVTVVEIPDDAFYEAAGLALPKYTVWWQVQLSHHLDLHIESEPQEIITDDVPTTLRQLALDLGVDPREPLAGWQRELDRGRPPPTRGDFWGDRYDLPANPRLQLLVEVWAEPDEPKAASKWERLLDDEEVV